MKKWNLPLTYAPKIQLVIDGTCRQTIRTGRKFNVGDLVRFYVWDGRPYHSKRRTVTEYAEIRYRNNCVIHLGGITHEPFDGCFGVDYDPWSNLDDIAKLDGIDPPTGYALGAVLKDKNTIPEIGIEAQIIRW